MIQRIINESVEEAVNQRMDDTGNVVRFEPVARPIKVDDEGMEMLGQFHGDLLVKNVFNSYRQSAKKVFQEAMDEYNQEENITDDDYEITDADIDEILEGFHG